ncbi:hypothetical protein HY991_02150 [Candidatus Micrarchaeota archaeon]|nr:hypothetical protein [Candidatus Micrarchaeota archaeon]
MKLWFQLVLVLMFLFSFLLSFYNIVFSFIAVLIISSACIWIAFKLKQYERKAAFFFVFVFSAVSILFLLFKIYFNAFILNPFLLPALSIFFIVFFLALFIVLRKLVVPSHAFGKAIGYSNGYAVVEMEESISHNFKGVYAVPSRRVSPGESVKILLKKNLFSEARLCRVE